MQPSLRRCMPNGLTLTRKKTVIKLTTGIGSSGGVKQIIANTVDFGASDAPLSDETGSGRPVPVPTVIGGVVLAVNIPCLKSGELVLDGKTLGDIYRQNQEVG